MTIIRRLDLTLEYSFHDIAASREINHDEALATLRLASKKTTETTKQLPGLSGLSYGGKRKRPPCPR